MAVVGFSEQQSERSVSGKFRESFNYSRGFRVRTDSPATSMLDIARAPGIVFGQPHPDDPSCLAMEFDCKPDGDSMLVWKVSVKYYLPPGRDGQTDEPPAAPGVLPPDQWGGSAGVTTGPVVEDRDGNPITNSAGIALSELEIEVTEYQMSLSRAYADTQFLELLRTFTNAVNSDKWAGGETGEWKCQGGRWSKKIENTNGITFTYYVVDWEFSFRAGGWKLTPWDIGYQQRVDASGNPSQSGALLGPIKGADGKPSKEPVSLDKGVAVAPGTAGFPKVINDGKGAEVYPEKSFAAFGNPK